MAGFITIQPSILFFLIETWDSWPVSRIGHPSWKCYRRNLVFPSISCIFSICIPSHHGSQSSTYVSLRANIDTHPMSRTFEEEGREEKRGGFGQGSPFFISANENMCVTVLYWLSPQHMWSHMCSAHLHTWRPGAAWKHGVHTAKKGVSKNKIKLLNLREKGKLSFHAARNKTWSTTFLIF